MVSSSKVLEAVRWQGVRDRHRKSRLSLPCLAQAHPYFAPWKVTRWGNWSYNQIFFLNHTEPMYVLGIRIDMHQKWESEVLSDNARVTKGGIITHANGKARCKGPTRRTSPENNALLFGRYGEEIGISDCLLMKAHSAGGDQHATQRDRKSPISGPKSCHSTEPGTDGPVQGCSFHAEPSKKKEATAIRDKPIVDVQRGNLKFRGKVSHEVVVLVNIPKN